MPALNEVIEWVASVDDPTLEAVLAALQSRHEELHESRASQAQIGTEVVIQDVEPRYLEGMSGEIVDLDPEEGIVALLLTPMDTGRLRFCGQRDYRVGIVERYRLENVPASCCYNPSSEGALTASA